MTAAPPLTGPVRIERLDPAALEAAVPQLAALLHACVHAGASVNFVLPFTQDDAAAFWRARMLPPMREGGRIVLAARLDERLVGTVALAVDTPPNQPHRAEVTKLLVHPRARRRGIARALMAELERVANSLGRTLLTLDTRTGDAAEPLYASLGYVPVGIIPAFSRSTDGDRLDATTIMYKHTTQPA